eukprot:TRINITY_DN78417_c0_g1_i1.p1 TRINITY_DN78417_c0_g1~~TRINITY_DN78417_c0_g1_i1.p1  ORF type:complete len:709 (-),score=166.60 TRINITY_DN78417_c0_g1_i1:55-2127(-)
MGQASSQTSCEAALRPKRMRAAKEGTRHQSTTSSSHIVEVDQVLARRGNKALITGRYTTSRLLEQDYDFDGKIVGSGMSGPVRLATGKDGRKYAIKSFKKNGLSARKRAELKSEAEVYLTLDHPHVAKLEIIYETDEEVHLVMEYMAGGELYKRLSCQKRYSEEAAARCIRQVLLAVAYLHAHQVVHRDLKLENFLYDSEDSDHLKLIDFGFAKFFDRDAKMSQACGSLHYVAPEVLEHAYTEKADMWSCGVIAYMLLTGAPPFFGTDEEVLNKIKAGTPHWSQRFRALSPQAQSFVQVMLVADVNKRLSAREALDHPFVCSSSAKETMLDADTLKSLRKFAHASAFRRAVLSMMAWSLSNQDRDLLREQFLILDREKRGTITHRELKQVLEENFHVDSAEAEALFSSLDTDSDDEIEYSEFLAAALIGRIHVHGDLLRKTFSRFDTSETGTITADDLRSVLGQHFDGAEMEELIQEADTSGNGRIDYDEFLAYFYRSEAELAEQPTPAFRSLPPMETQVFVPTADTLPTLTSLPPLNSSPPLGVLSEQCGEAGPPIASGLLDPKDEPICFTQSAPVYTQASWAKKQARTEKLGAVIDHLLSKGYGHREARHGLSKKIPRRPSKGAMGLLRPLSRRFMPAVEEAGEEPRATAPKVSAPAMLRSNRAPPALPTLLQSAPSLSPKETTKHCL